MLAAIMLSSGSDSVWGAVEDGRAADATPGLAPPARTHQCTKSYTGPDIRTERWVESEGGRERVRGGIGQIKGTRAGQGQHDTNLFVHPRASVAIASRAADTQEEVRAAQHAHGCAHAKQRTYCTCVYRPGHTRTLCSACVWGRIAHGQAECAYACARRRECRHTRMHQMVSVGFAAYACQRHPDI